MARLSAEKEVALNRIYEDAIKSLRYVPQIPEAGAKENVALARAWVAANFGVGYVRHFNLTYFNERIGGIEESWEDTGSVRDWLTKKLNTEPKLSPENWAPDVSKNWSRNPRGTAGLVAAFWDELRNHAKSADDANFAEGRLHAFWEGEHMGDREADRAEIALANRLYPTEMYKPVGGLYLPVEADTTSRGGGPLRGGEVVWDPPKDVSEEIKNALSGTPLHRPNMLELARGGVRQTP